MVDRINPGWQIHAADLHKAEREGKQTDQPKQPPDAWNLRQIDSMPKIVPGQPHGSAKHGEQQPKQHRRRKRNTGDPGDLIEQGDQREAQADPEQHAD